MTDFVLAVDGGGTATSAALVDGLGRVLWQGRGGRSNPTDSTQDALRRHLEELLAPAAEPAGGRFDIFAGVAGGAHPALRARLEDALRGIFPGAGRIEVTHDGVNALYRGTHGRPGAAVIAGTGSVVMAVGEDAREYRAGGWGYLLGDEGSAYDLGRRGAAAVLAAHDGAGPATALAEALTAALGAASPPDIVPELYAGGRTRIASLAAAVSGVAERGDAQAARIVRESAEALAARLLALLPRLPCPRPVPVVVSGGVWNSRFFTDAFRAACAGAGGIRWVQPEMPPVYGAAVQQRVRRGLPPSREFALNFAASAGIGYRPEQGEWPWNG